MSVCMHVRWSLAFALMLAVPAWAQVSRGYIRAYTTVIANDPSRVYSDSRATYIALEPHCSTNCINELAGTHQIIQYGPGMIAGIYFRTSFYDYKGRLCGFAEPEQCYYGLVDQITYTFKNPPPSWNEPTILASLNDERSAVRCTPAVSSAPTPVSDPYGGSPDGAKTESPIVIDVAGTGYGFTSPAAGVEFDIRASDTPVRVAWTDPVMGNAFLARDRSGNGRIDSGAELFGDHTPLASGQIAANGFVALAELDQNRDGLVDVADAGWSTLLLWTDRNHDGISTANELQNIADSTIAAFETDHQRIGKRDVWGNTFRFVARYRDRGGREHKYYDVYLRTVE